MSFKTRVLEKVFEEATDTAKKLFSNTSKSKAAQTLDEIAKNRAANLTKNASSSAKMASTGIREVSAKDFFSRVVNSSKSVQAAKNLTIDEAAASAAESIPKTVRKLDNVELPKFGEIKNHNSNTPNKDSLIKSLFGSKARNSKLSDASAVKRVAKVDVQTAEEMTILEMLKQFLGESGNAASFIKKHGISTFLVMKMTRLVAAMSITSKIYVFTLIINQLSKLILNNQTVRQQVEDVLDIKLDQKTLYALRSQTAVDSMRSIGLSVTSVQLMDLIVLVSQNFKSNTLNYLLNRMSKVVDVDYAQGHSSDEVEEVKAILRSYKVYSSLSDNQRAYLEEKMRNTDFESFTDYQSQFEATMKSIKATEVIPSIYFKLLSDLSNEKLDETTRHLIDNNIEIDLKPYVDEFIARYPGKSLEEVYHYMFEDVVRSESDGLPPPRALAQSPSSPAFSTDIVESHSLLPSSVSESPTTDDGGNGFGGNHGNGGAGNGGNGGSSGNGGNGSDEHNSSWNDGEGNNEIVKNSYLDSIFNRLYKFVQGLGIINYSITGVSALAAANYVDMNAIPRDAEHINDDHSGGFKVCEAFNPIKVFDICSCTSSSDHYLKIFNPSRQFLEAIWKDNKIIDEGARLSCKSCMSYEDIQMMQRAYVALLGQLDINERTLLKLLDLINDPYKLKLIETIQNERFNHSIIK